jgi:hypothetical protein
LSGEQWHSELRLADYTAFHIVPARSVQPVRAYAILQPFQTADLVAATAAEGREVDPPTRCKPCLRSAIGVLLGGGGFLPGYGREVRVLRHPPQRACSCPQRRPSCRTATAKTLPKGLCPLAPARGFPSLPHCAALRLCRPRGFPLSLRFVASPG